LNVGAIVSLSVNKEPLTSLLGVDEETLLTVLGSWGPGKFDASIFVDGKAFQPDGSSAATLIPPAFGLAGINLHTFEGWGGISHWNAFVANLEMHGQGTFYDPRLNDAERFPIAAANNFGNVRTDNDLITSKLAALQFYQLSLPAPAHQKVHLLREQLSPAKRCLTVKQNVQPAMFRLFLPSRVGTCILQNRWYR